MSIDKLLPDVKVGPYTVRPWSLGQLSDAADPLAQLLGKAQEVGLDLDAAMDGNIDQIKFLQTILKGMPHVVEILMISFAKEREEIRGLDLAISAQLVKAVAAANWDQIKNSFAPPPGADQNGASKT